MDSNSSWKGTSIPQLEHCVLQHWRNIHAIEKVIEKTSNKKSIVFIDGPPFCTGNFHYGHGLVSTIKDTMARYFTMNGFDIDRGYGFDTHGVPMEMAAKKVIGYNTKQELLDYGIDNHNDVCRDLISTCSARWQKDFERIGRWVDPKREYKTMDLNFMESVIWAFKELYNKDMIFEGYKVMPYSTGCNTPLSHFEAKQNYKIVTDQTVICCFEIVSTENSTFKHNIDYPNYILAWTTTPWTLPSNMALCTGMNIAIVYLFDYQTNSYLLMSNSKFETTYSKLKYNNVNRFRIVDRLVSYDLANVEYKPPFTHFWNYEQNKKLDIGERPFRVLIDNYVKESGDDAGTGFVHCSAGHGEEDFRVCCQNNIIDNKNSKQNLINVVDDDGCFSPAMKEYAGMYVKKADLLIIKDLKARGLIFDSKPYTHSYPHCYRTDTPLLYRTVTAWFLNASNPIFREKMLANNAKINWMPANVGSNDFDSWLQGSVDWCISRSRFWGTPIPIWKSDDGEEVICIGSIKELCDLSGIKNISDLHIEHIDKIKIPSKEGRGMLSRVEGVLDCWFESGSVPYGQHHYPFENAHIINPEKTHIADFITESKDQTRGWFYTLTVLATALFNKPAFQNVIVTGIINGTDGEKMSKSKGNYPDPNILIEKYGADVLRLYLLSTPVVKAESVKFDETAISKLQQNSIVKIYNITLLLVEKINLYNKDHINPITYPSKTQLHAVSNILDRWIINKTGLLVKDISQDMNTYRINQIASKILIYIEQLTNWYVKMARERLKGSSSRFNNDYNDWCQSLQVLLFVLYQFIRIAAPVLPFITETIYGKIKPYLVDPLESIHFSTYPTIDEFVYDDSLENKFYIIQQVITTIREIRDSVRINNRRPIISTSIGCINPTDWEIIQDILDYVKTESNVMSVTKLNLDGLIITTAEPIASEIKDYLFQTNNIKHMRTILQFITNMDENKIAVLQKNGTVSEPTTGIIIKNNFINIKYLLKTPDPQCKIYNNIIVKLDTTYSDEVEKEHLIRLINTAIQMHRKNKLLKPWDVITVTYYTESKKLIEFINTYNAEFISKNVVSITRCPILYKNSPSVHNIMDMELQIVSSLVDN